MNHVSRFALCLSSFVALAAVACSGAPDPVPSSSSSKANTAGDTKTPSGSKTPASNSPSSPSSPSTPAPSTPLSDTSACGKKADANTCDECCLAGSPMAMDAADKAAGDCMCAAAACQTACAASVCSPTDNMNQPTDACGMCLDAHQQECGAKFDAVCNADAACKAANACMTSQCDPLAMMSGGSSGSSGSSSGGAADGVSRAASAASITARMMARSAGLQ
jgi:hypothetical protein